MRTAESVGGNGDIDGTPCKEGHAEGRVFCLVGGRSASTPSEVSSIEGREPPPRANGTEVAGGAAPTPLTEPDMDQEVADTATHPSPQGPDSTGHKVPDVSYHGPVIKTPSRLSRFAVRGRNSAFTSFPFCCQYQGPGRAVGAPWATTVP